MSKHSKPTGPRILAYDIERVPALAYTWGLYDQRIGINQVVLPGETVSWAARWVGDPKSKVVFRSTFHHGKERMLSDLWDLWDQADALMGWNSTGFDRKHVQTEFLLAGLNPPTPSKEIDLMRAVKRQFKFLSNKLDWVSGELGVGKKIAHEGFGLWSKVMAGDERAWTRFQRYNEQDVHLLLDLYAKLLPWLPSNLNANLYGADGCPRCGQSGTLQSRGTRRTTVATYPRYWCAACGGWSTGTRRIDGVTTRAEN